MKHQFRLLDLYFFIHGNGLYIPYPLKFIIHNFLDFYFIEKIVTDDDVGGAIIIIKFCAMEGSGELPASAKTTNRVMCKGNAGLFFFWAVVENKTI